MDFVTWLVEVKQMAKKSAGDVQSRLNRALGMIDEKDVSLRTIDKLEKSDGFNSASPCVKSLLKRAVKLYLEYKTTEKKND